MGGETYNPASGRAYRSDGSVANLGDSYNDRNKKITLSSFDSENEKGNAFGFQATETLAAAGNAGDTITGAVEAVNPMYIKNSLINIVDLDNQIIDVKVEYLSNITVISGTVIPSAAVNLNQGSDNQSQAIYYDTDVVLDETNVIYNPFGVRVKSDRKSAAVQALPREYIATEVSAVRITNLGIGQVEVRYSDFYFE